MRLKNCVNLFSLNLYLKSVPDHGATSLEIVACCMIKTGALRI
jgi:hypothetical protein